MGGMPNAYNSSDALEAYDPSTNTWSTKSPMPVARNSFAAVTGQDGKVYAIGGFTNTLTNRVDVYDPATDTWSSGHAMPTARDFCGAAVIDGKIYVIGGGRSVSNGRLVQMYDPSTNTWTTKSPMPTSRYAMGVAVADGKIYVIGGGLVWTSTATNIVEVYDPQTDTWSTKSPMPGPRYRLAAVTGPDGKIYAIGGSDGGGHLVNKVEAYDPKTDTWSSAPYLPSQRWDLAAAAGQNGTIYAIGGYSYNPYGRTNTVLAYSPVRIVSIDIKPGSYPNYFNNDGHGVIPVAILTTESFDAATVDPFSVSLDGADVRAKGKSGNAGSLEDVDSDGDLDLVLQIEDVDNTYQAGETIATLTGVTFDGTPIRGEDTICIVP
jgi:N-acetylneuraminic acid mutarotase